MKKDAALRKSRRARKRCEGNLGEEEKKSPERRLEFVAAETSKGEGH